MSVYGFMRHRIEKDRIRALRTGPVLQTLDGARARVAALPLRDLTLLCSYFDCEVAELHERLWVGWRQRGSRRRPRPSRRQKPAETAASVPAWYKQHPTFQEMES